MAFDVSETRVIPLADSPHRILLARFPSSLSNLFCLIGDEIIRATKREDDVKESRSRIPSHATSTIAEEAVDQLHASEKLIAGKYRRRSHCALNDQF